MLCFLFNFNPNYRIFLVPWLCPGLRCPLLGLDPWKLPLGRGWIIADVIFLHSKRFPLLVFKQSYIYAFIHLVIHFYLLLKKKKKENLRQRILHLSLSNLMMPISPWLLSLKIVWNFDSIIYPIISSFHICFTFRFSQKPSIFFPRLRSQAQFKHFRNK